MVRTRRQSYRIEAQTKWPLFCRRQFQVHFLKWKLFTLNEISLKYAHYGLIDNMTALVQIMAWRRTGDKPLSEAILLCFTDECMRHSTSLGFKLTSPGQNCGNNIDDNFKSSFFNENRSFFFSLRNDWWEAIIGLNNGLAPNRRQAII